MQGENSLSQRPSAHCRNDLAIKSAHFIKSQRQKFPDHSSVTVVSVFVCVAAVEVYNINANYMYILNALKQ